MRLILTNRVDKAKSEAARLLALRERHRHSVWECPAGHRQLSLKDPLAKILLVEPGDDAPCPECLQKLEALGLVEKSDFIVQMPPRGINPEDPR